ncbi:MAG TPA: M20/M25/M40 family metallo-hydrolase [Candidatus Ruthenibacterium merdipullorum]|nr:M20/M25/M40 family metallo-hydrolase [Candidatus Ruthenibacterium merdipullorum]
MAAHMKWKQELQAFCNANMAQVQRLTHELCAIPAPTGSEGRRAQFCLSYLRGHGAQAYLDEAGNVVFPYACEGGGKVVVMAAHMDTVFPEETPLGVREEGDKAFCPGIGDDTANLAVLLVLAAWFAQHAPRTEQGIVFVCNVCEEGLGNLKGTRALMRQWAARTVAFLSLDCTCEAVFHRAVGSKRYRVTAHTEGGHSFSAFGNTNAIEVIARLVQDIYALPVPQHAGSTTTYNVGLIEGGTSVNAIAQQASCVCEFRSDDEACMAQMERSFETLFARARARCLSLEVELLGTRPAGKNVPAGAQAALTEVCVQAVEQAFGTKPQLASASTDCNIPLSMGIPSACFGCLVGGGAHTLEEWIKPASLGPGLMAAGLVLCGLL